MHALQSFSCHGLGSRQRALIGLPEKIDLGLQQKTADLDEPRKLHQIRGPNRFFVVFLMAEWKIRAEIL